jgi:chromosome partitioning protein
MPIISFASSKGGAGKTTACIVLGTELAESATVTIIDADPAARLFSWSEIAPVPKQMQVVRSKGERHILAEMDDATQRSLFVLVDLEASASRLASFAIGGSDLVVIPSGEEQQDANAAIETLSEVQLEARSRRRDIPAVVLLTRTSAAVKTRLEKHIGHELRQVCSVLPTELHRRTAFSALHNQGGGLRSLKRETTNGVDKAIGNARAYTNDIITILENSYAKLGGQRRNLPRWNSPAVFHDAQISIKAPSKVIDEFRAICVDDRRTYGDMLEILINLYNDRDRKKS